MRYYTAYDFDYTLISSAPCQKRRRGNQGRRINDFVYKDLMCAFDIECTNLHSIGHAFMYIWQFQIEDYTIIGRYWMEFKKLLTEIEKALNNSARMVIFSHNLSYEFSFLKGILKFEPDDVFCIDSRKVLRASYKNFIEFRCSYLLTNMSLAVFTERMGVTKKLSGEEYDYSKVRYPWSELTENELAYCITDVVALVQALKVYFSIEHDNFYTIPYTSTGFVRRDVKKAMRRFNKDDLKAMLPDYNLYMLMVKAFRGGDTHANRFYAGEILENVSSYDRVSSYPDVQINEYFPMGEWFHEPDADAERVIRKIYKQKRAGLIRVEFTNIRLKDPMNGAPYIAKHKCERLGSHDNDNGRILYASILELVLTDIDFKIILDEYDYDDMLILDFYHSRYGRLPKPLRDCVIKYFEDKTRLKGIEGQELFYMLQKMKLNSIYGLCVQRVLRDKIIYADGEFFTEEIDGFEEIEKHNAKAFMAFQWGVWTTVRARFELRKAINLVGAHRFVYCDTDSVKFIDDGSVSFDDYNNERKEQSNKNGGIAIDSKGRTQYLGLYEYEGTYEKFCSLGAKKYCFVKDGKTSITISGVGKSIGSKELEERGGIDNFKEGFTFYKAGGTESVYNDKVNEKIEVDGHELIITDNVYIRDSTYTLGTTEEYKRILQRPKLWLDRFK